MPNFDMRDKGSKRLQEHFAQAYYELCYRDFRVELKRNGINSMYVLYTERWNRSKGITHLVKAVNNALLSTCYSKADPVQMKMLRDLETQAAAAEYNEALRRAAQQAAAQANAQAASHTRMIQTITNNRKESAQAQADDRDSNGETYDDKINREEKEHYASDSYGSDDNHTFPSEKDL